MPSCPLSCLTLGSLGGLASPPVGRAEPPQPLLATSALLGWPWWEQLFWGEEFRRADGGQRGARRQAPRTALMSAAAVTAWPVAERPHQERGVRMTFSSGVWGGGEAESHAGRPGRAGPASGRPGWGGGCDRPHPRPGASFRPPSGGLPTQVPVVPPLTSAGQGPACACCSAGVPCRAHGCPSPVCLERWPVWGLQHGSCSPPSPSTAE